MSDSPAPSASTPRGLRLVVMGVAGCGKSAVGGKVACALRLPLVEGDSFHPPANIEKMRRGLPLQDADRAEWLHLLGLQLQAHPDGVVLTCSALKRAYREQLRAAAPGLVFLHLVLTPAQARERVAGRRDHFYPPSLVDSQFAALEDPTGELRVVDVDGHQPFEAVVQQALAALRPFNNA